MQIQIATLQHIEKIAPLFDAYRQFYEQESNVKQAFDYLTQRIKNRESIILFAEDAHQQVVGFCQLYPSFCSVIAARIYVLYDLFTKPEARKSGVGAALLNAAHQHAKDQGVARMDLTTAKNNFPAQSLYQSQGWIRDDIFYTYNKTV